MPLVLVALSEEQQAGAAQSPQELWMVWMVLDGQELSL